VHGNPSGDPGSDEFTRRVVSEAASLGVGAVLTVAEFAPEQATRWELYFDLTGTPHVTASSLPWADLAGPGGAPSSARLGDHIRPVTPDRWLLAYVRPAQAATDPASQAAAAFDLARQLYPDVPRYHIAVPVRDLIRDARREFRLPLWYRLALLRPRPDGTLIMTTQRLFPPGARWGDQRPFPIWVEPAEDPRTAFAVLALDDDADRPDYRLVSLQSAQLPVGPHQVTATLVGPGLVRFEGLPEPLTDDPRTWPEVEAAVPGQIPASHPAHLIIAVELCDPQLRYVQRLDCAMRLIQDVADDARAPVRYSLAAYGSHAFPRMTDEPPIEELCWLDEAPMALAALSRLRNRPALTGGSAHGAKLECALHHVAGRLATGTRVGERPVLVTIGTRPPFPHAQDPGHALPCKQGLDWRKTLTAMADRHDGMAFGAVYDGEPVAEAWRHLGCHARGLPSGFASRQFAADLGLITPAPPAMPLPLTRQPPTRDRRG
jgi:hypothetical protein